MQEFNYLKGRFKELGIKINHHYLDRYLKFVLSASRLNKKIEYGENHHILPKAKDMFPHLRKIAWNQKVLGARTHYIAHWMLTKALPGNEGQASAFRSMKYALERV